MRHGEIRRRDGELDEPAHLLDFLRLDEILGSEVATSPAIWQANSVASKAVMREMPFWPPRIACQHFSVPIPTERDQTDARHDDSSRQD